MSGKKLKASPLELRKRLLVAESEINRALLAKEGRTLAVNLHGMTQQIRNLGAVVSSVTALVGLIKAFRNRNAATAAPKASWFSIGLKLFRLGVPLWISLRGKKTAVSSNGQIAD